MQVSYPDNEGKSRLLTQLNEGKAIQRLTSQAERRLFPADGEA